MSRMVDESEIRNRLSRKGKSPDEINEIIDRYVSIPSQQLPDTGSISTILEKTEQDSVLRVKGFKLNRDQFDALLSYFEESGKLLDKQQVEGSQLVEMMLVEFVELIS